MSKDAKAGELRTWVRFVEIVRTIDGEGYPQEQEQNVFDKAASAPLGTAATGEDVKIPVKWVNAHGTDAYTAMQMQLREPATITCRYSPLIHPRCLIYRGSEELPFEIISIDNVGERNAWLEIKVQRRVAAK